MRLLGRRRELGLLLFAIALYTVGYTSLLIERGQPLVARAYEGPAIFAASACIVHFWLCALRFRGDELLFPIVAFLVALSLLMVDRLRPALVESQMAWFLLTCGVVVVVVTLGRDVSWLARYKYTFAVAGLSLLGATAVFGREVNGARLWIQVGSLSFQTSELMKLVLVIFLAAYLDEKRELLSLATLRWKRLRLPPVAYLGPLLSIWALSLLSLLWQHDLGGTLLLLGVALAMIFVATGRLYYVVGGIALFLLNLFVTYHFFAYVRSRIDVWLSPWQYAQDQSYQIVQALYALASGGVLGSGLGQGSPRYIPEVHTDFIFVAIAEEMGLLGATAVLALFLVLIFRGLRVALGARSVFEQLLAVGFASTFALQCLVIVAGNVELIPLTGITLPFVSYGGSSMTVNAMLLGLVMCLSTRTTSADRS